MSKKDVITQNNCRSEIKSGGGGNRINWIAESIFAKDNESKLFTYIVKHQKSRQLKRLILLFRLQKYSTRLF